ncbi:hypothetical protein BH11MYX1_BH11MYX1_04310 [soil metagenome]
MEALSWSWLAAPYLACALAFASVGVAAMLTRGDRVVRLGMIGAVVTAMPWALCQGISAMAHDPEAARRLLKLGQGPVALIGPNLLLLLLAVGGQLERFRWVARIAGVIGTVFLALAWGTDLIVPGVQHLASGLYYMAPGPLTGVHLMQLVIWLVIGIAIVRRSVPRAEERRTLRLLLGILVLGAVTSADTLLLYTGSTPWGSYPMSWLPAFASAMIALYLIVRTNILRPQGLDRGMALELATSTAAGGATVVLALLFGDSPLTLATAASIVWASLSAIAWGYARARPPQPVAEQRALDQFVARVATLDDGAKIAERLTTLWSKSIHIEVQTVRWGETLKLAPELASWLASHAQAIAVDSLATMKLGKMRDPLVELGRDARGGLMVPLVDRDELVGLVEATCDRALRDGERELVTDSARAAARAFSFVALAKSATLERETAREVEVADALRLQASASRDAQLGKWVVTAEYRTATRTTGAGWSATELGDGRLALLVTEAQAHGVTAALATAALTGAFAAATTPGSRPITLDELVATMRASSDGVIRGGEPVAAFLAILDAKKLTIEWACAGHPGAFLVGPIAGLDSELPVGSIRAHRPRATPLGSSDGSEGRSGASLEIATRGFAPLPVDMALVVASSGLRGAHSERWREVLKDCAPSGGRLATTLVELALRHGAPVEDLLAVVVRTR